MKQTISTTETAPAGNKTRRLAAIMFADIVGYTAMMQENEKMAAHIRARHREIFESQHKKFRGDIIQYYGDGSLSVFDSAIEAVQCATSIQRLCQEKPKIPLRIGIHVGDIVFSDADIYGDGVNVASRIESMGASGGIFISGKLNDELKNHQDIITTSLGFFELKNVTQPMEIYAVKGEGLEVPDKESLQKQQNKISKTIAVLPFVNMSPDEENEYFSDGITEEIINALAKIKNLKVTSRTSSFFFKNKNIPITEIGKELNVSVLLEGSIRVAGNMIRITAQLIHAEEDFHFWSETWDRKLENIFEIQDEISLLIAEKLREHLGHFEIQEHLVDKQTDNIDAYEYSLKAKFHFNKWNPEDMRIAISLYEKALVLDPGHTESYLGLADAYGFMATTGFMPIVETWQKVAELTQKAHSLKKELPGVHYQLANLAFFTQADYFDAFKEASRAVELQPNYAEAQQLMFFLYVLAGENEKAKMHLDVAYSINPLSPETLFYQGYFDYVAGRYKAALDKFDRVLGQNPKNIPAFTIKCHCLIRMEQYDEAIRHIESALPNVLADSDKTGLLAIAYAKKGNQQKALGYKENLDLQANDVSGFRADSFRFLLYAHTNQREKAFDWIAKNLESSGFSLLIFLFADPLVDPIKDDRRYHKYRKLIFPETEAPEESKSKKALLDNEAANQFTDKLMVHIREHKPYLEPALSIRSLAEQTGIHPNQLSWLLNEKFGKNFNDFINHYRVENYKKLAQDPKNKHLTLMALAYDSGFNSKTVFNTYFKKETGMTPKEFVNSSASH